MFAHQELIGFGAADAAGFRASAVTFDGTNDFLSRGSDFTGNADSKQGSLSIWIKFASLAAAMTLIDGQGDIPEIRVNTSGATLIDLYNSAVSGVLRISTSNLTTGVWYNILASWDLSASTSHLYVNDVSDKSTITGPVNDFVDYTRTNHWVGARSGSTQKLNADVADFWWAPGTYIDFSSSTNRRKFISAAGKPVYLGANGELPTGSSPILFLSGDATSFATNKGTGGGMTTTGALTDATTSPSD